MKLPKWSIIAAAVVVVIAVIIIIIPGKKKQSGEETVSVRVNNAETTNAETANAETTNAETANAETTNAEAAAEHEVTVDKQETVKSLSTKENANAMDFEWFMDMELFDGTDAGIIITEPGRVERISGSDNILLNGGWKAYQLDTKKPYNPEVVRYFNADIDTEGEKFNITMNWAYMFMTKEGQSVTEDGSDLFEGTWNASDGTVTAQSDWAKVEFDNFYIASDGTAEYATGTFYWISGEIERIALMRVAE